VLLQRLVKYATEPGATDMPAFYARRPVRWILDIAADGTPDGGFIDSSDRSDPDRKFGAVRVVPAITRTAGVAPVLAVDNGEYVFGWLSDDGKPERVQKQYDAFRQLITRWANAEPTGPGRAIAAFYEHGRDRRLTPPDGWTRGDLIGFRVAGVYAADTPEAKRFWATVAGERKGSGRTGRCLVCGTIQPLLQTIPQQIPQRWLPGASQGASLVSVNEVVHGYDLQKFLTHTPICEGCGLKFMSALTDLLSRPEHSTTLTGQNARLAWWVVGGSTFDPWESLDQPDEAKIRGLLTAPVSGSASSIDDLSTYCSVTVGGNVARVVVRDWVEQPLPAIRQNIAAWYADCRIVDAWTGNVVSIRLSQLARAAGRWQAGRGGANGSWVKFGGSGEDRPSGVFHGLLRSALLHRPLPPRLLNHVVNRIRTDGRIDNARAALIRLALRRHTLLPDSDRERLNPTLNVENRTPAYIAGRVLAVMDDLQRAVFRAADQNLNTTFAERYFGRAIDNPQLVLVAGRRTATAWLRRLRGPLRRPAWATAYQNRLDDLFVEMGSEMPGHTVVVQKGQFILGYHHQRADLRAQRIAAAANKTKTDLPPMPDDDQPDSDREGDDA
jgi:CRISPR-associated protein Csd1